MLISVAVCLSACKYRKGDRYASTAGNDSLQYLILDKGSGMNLSKKAAFLKLQHEYKGNVCQVRYVTDSALLNTQKGILLFNSTMPNIDNDILTKGFFGSLTSKQIVVYVLVSYQDFDKNFLSAKLPGK
jgi:hypothetical protein